MRLMVELTCLVNWFILPSCWAVKHARAIWIDRRFMESRRRKELFLWQTMSSISLPGNWSLCKTLRTKKKKRRKGKWNKQKISEDQREVLGQTNKKAYKQQPVLPKCIQTGILMFLEMFKSCVLWVCKNTCGFWLVLLFGFLLHSSLNPTYDLSITMGLYSMSTNNSFSQAMHQVYSRSVMLWPCTLIV